MSQLNELLDYLNENKKYSIKEKNVDYIVYLYYNDWAIIMCFCALSRPRHIQFEFILIRKAYDLRCIYGYCLCFRNGLQKANRK